VPEFQWTQVGTFGGGLNFNAQPQSIADNEWSWSDGFFPDEQSAVPLPFYRQLLPGSFFTGLAPAQTAFGILPNPFSVTSPILILTYENGATDPAPVRLYRSDGTTAGTQEITWDGVTARPTRYQAHRTAPQSAYLDQWLCITVGSGDVGYSILRWTGGATFSTLIVGATFRCAHLESFGGYLIGAAWGTSQRDMRRIKISDANSTTVWTPDISNSADDIVLDDSMSGIVGLGLLNANALGIFTRSGLYALSPTGNIPPFTRSYVGMFPAADSGIAAASAGFYTQSAPLIGATPYGTGHVGYSNVYSGVETPVGTKIWRYLTYLGDSSPNTLPPSTPRIVWHPRLRAMIVSTIAHRPPQDGFFYYNPIGEAWGWQSSHFVGLGKDQALVFLGMASTPDPFTWTHVTLDASGAVWGEYPPLTPRPGIFVDTKDFALPADRYVDAVKVDWEPLFANSQLKVSVIARSGMHAGIPGGQPIFGSPGYAQDLTAVFDAVPPQQVITMPPGATESSMRSRGKFIRFRFQVVAGLARIRGFSFRTALASDRLTDVRLLVSPILGGYWDHPAWDRVQWNLH
jgi:hypothetical protein